MWLGDPYTKWWMTMFGWGWVYRLLDPVIFVLQWIEFYAFWILLIDIIVQTLVMTIPVIKTLAWTYLMGMK